MKISKKTVSNSRKEETLHAKAVWFQSLSLEERMQIFCDFTDLILENYNPNIVNERQDANRLQNVFESLQSQIEDLISSKRAARRKIDLENFPRFLS